MAQAAGSLPFAVEVCIDALHCLAPRGSPFKSIFLYIDNCILAIICLKTQDDSSDDQISSSYVWTDCLPPTQVVVLQKRPRLQVASISHFIYMIHQ